MDVMVRWQPGSEQRLAAAALELYAERGFEQTTAAEIAESVGLTERTFFRYFADKREVQFAGQDRFQQVFVDGIAAAPEGGSALETVAFALDAAASFFPDERRPYSRLRQTVLDANPSLQERELLKSAWLASAMAAALRERGVPDPQATLAAYHAGTVFTVSFRQWIAEDETRSIADIERAMFRELQDLTR